MASLETVIVESYRTTSGTANPNIDTVVGTDNSVVGGGVNWSFNTTGWNANRWLVYCVGYDVAGNQTAVGSAMYINVTSDPAKVSDTVAWTVGDWGNVLIGTLKDDGVS